MNPPVIGPLTADPQRQRDCDHLKLLSIFHFVGAGLALLGIAFLFLHYFLMSHFFLNPEVWKSQPNSTPPPKELFSIFIVFYFFAGLFLTLCCILNFLSGIFLGNRKHRMFSMVVGGINCMHFPLGTVLGAFTIAVLARDSVRQLYSKS